MSDIYPLTIVKDRYNGAYSGGRWTAWNLGYVPSKIDVDDTECAGFFAKPNLIYGRGETPEEAIEDLKHRLVYGTHMTKEYIKEVRESTEDEEDNKMNATSVQVINAIKEMNVTFEKSPLEETRIIINVSTDDDTYEFNCSGPGCEKFLRKMNFVPTKEYEYVYNQLMEREKEINDLKKKHEKKIKQIEKELDLERAANEAHHRFFHQYAGRGTEIEFNYAIDEVDEVTYVIVDKDRYQTLKDNSNRCTMINGRSYTPNQMVDRILELEELKTPTIENFVDEKPSSRADILDQAKKCVCGQREQDYGTPESNFQLIADLWNGYLGGRTDNPVISVTPVDVSMMMALLKIARIRNGGGSGDSFVDLAGYAACGGEIWAGEKKN